VVYDIYRPIGSWKNEINGTYAIDKNGRQLFIEYATPTTVPILMTELINYINTVDIQSLTNERLSSANKKNFEIKAYAEIYAKIHMGVVHIHPFFDGNGRIARLLANIPLLKAGLPPLIISQEQRRTYIQTLANYQIAAGQLNQKTGVWPDPEMLDEFTSFCASCYGATEQLLNQALALQANRNK
jgi:Fic family protein